MKNIITEKLAVRQRAMNEVDQLNEGYSDDSKTTIKNAIDYNLWLCLFYQCKLFETMTDSEIKESLSWSDSEKLPSFTQNNIDFMMGYFSIPVT